MGDISNDEEKSPTGVTMIVRRRNPQIQLSKLDIDSIRFVSVSLHEKFAL